MTTPKPGDIVRRRTGNARYTVTRLWRDERGTEQVDLAPLNGYSPRTVRPDEVQVVERGEVA